MLWSHTIFLRAWHDSSFCLGTLTQTVESNFSFSPVVSSLSAIFIVWSIAFLIVIVIFAKKYMYHLRFMQWCYVQLHLAATQFLVFLFFIFKNSCLQFNIVASFTIFRLLNLLSQNFLKLLLHQKPLKNQRRKKKKKSKKIANVLLL